MTIVHDMSIEAQAWYYIYLTRNIVNYYYQDRHIPVIPSIPTKPKSMVCVYPDLQLISDKNFIKSIIRGDKNEMVYMDNISNKAMVDNVLPSIKYIYKVIDIFELKKEVKEKQKKFFKILYSIFGTENQISKVTIIPTSFGTNSSFHYIDKNSNSIELFLTIRSDSLKSEFVFRNIINAYAKKQISYLNENNVATDWLTAQSLRRFIINATPLKKYASLSRNKPGFHHDTIQTSTKYISKLGYPIKSLFKSIDNNIHFNNKVISGLSHSEILILAELIKEKNKVVSFDKISEILYGDLSSEKFSLCAITKLVERIRNVLSQNGIDKRLIVTVRKKGYVLYN